MENNMMNKIFEKFIIQKKLVKGIVVSILSIFIIHIFSTPAYFALSPECKPCPECCDMQKKIDRKDYLLSSVKSDFEPGTHMAKTEFRLTPALFFKIFNISDKYGAYFLQIIFGFIFFYFIYSFTYNFNISEGLKILYTISFCFIYVGYSFVAEMGGFFDSFAYLLILICMVNSNISVIFISMLLALYTDERVLLSSLFLMIWWQIFNSNTELKSFFTPKIQSLSIIVAISIYIGTRYLLIYFFDFQNQFKGTNELLYTFNLMGLSFWQCFEGFWLIIILSLITFYNKNQYFLAFLLIGLFLFGFIASHFVSDVTRSTAYVFPLILILSYSLFRANNTNYDFKFIIMIVLILSFLYPSYQFIANKPPQWYKPIYIRALGKILNIP